MFKRYIQRKVQKYVRQYFSAHPEVKLVVVAGSVGKTSTKIAAATILSERYRVRLHEGNHNTHFSAPLAILGIEYPDNVKSIFAWLAVFCAARQRIRRPSDVDVIIQELGVDAPGDMAAFGSYLLPDIAVVTAVTPEHMEYFKTMEAVAQEELSVAQFSKLVIINRDDIDGRHAAFLTNANIVTYGTSGAAEYRFVDEDFEIESGHKGLFVAPEFPDGVATTAKVVGEHNLRPVIGAATIAVKLGLNAQEIAKGIAKIRPVPGRMNILRGVRQTVLIDDTYNSSPLAAASALQTLYSLQAPQRIAVLGSMNELGEMSPAEHEALGKICDPNQLAWVVTVGEEAERYLAPAARAQGCQVKSFRNALDAGGFVHQVLDDGAVILFKGSQTNVFTEEALKVVLHSAQDADQLVRQSPAWLARKSSYFSKFS
jgi:UDP-N-acetylmuramoyl-tripeptide--D-alanyl-D-alanine ligase